ncbi:MAG: HigA family addiction module antitoxin [Dethiobacteria bacterium]|nr:HigA family addiction module antidote protein [Bacillota bacterium]MDW7729942.1 HigA family addiction module antitoxin [Bacillota bacterium]
MNRIKTPTIGRILKEEFVEPNNISLYRLAKDINVPTSRILEIIHGKRRITVQTGLKLARYFGTSDKFFINLQADVDIREEKQNIWHELEEIKHVHA